MIPILGSATAGLASATSSASRAATDLSRVSKPEPGDPDVATDFVTLSTASAGVEVATKLAHTAQEDDRAMLDIIA